MDSSVGDSGLTWVTVGGWVVAIVLGAFTAITQFRKSRVDESALILGSWKEMVEAHKAMVNQHDAELKELREYLRVEREDNEKLRTRVHELEDQVAGLRRNIAQLGQSTAIQLGDPFAATPAVGAAMKRMEERG